MEIDLHKTQMEAENKQYIDDLHAQISCLKDMQRMSQEQNRKMETDLQKTSAQRKSIHEELAQQNYLKDIRIEQMTEEICELQKHQDELREATVELRKTISNLEEQNERLNDKIDAQSEQDRTFATRQSFDASTPSASASNKTTTIQAAISVASGAPKCHTKNLAAIESYESLGELTSEDVHRLSSNPSTMFEELIRLRKENRSLKLQLAGHSGSGAYGVGASGDRDRKGTQCSSATAFAGGKGSQRAMNGNRNSGKYIR
jgi:chromosome segregation ATPase